MARVLIIDDDFSVLEVLRDFVAALGHEAITAATGGIGLQLVSQRKPHVVLVDLAMPAPSGYEVLTVLRRDHPEIPVIMVTAQVDVAIAQGLIARGAFDHVAKPFTMGQLDDVIRRALVSGATYHSADDTLTFEIGTDRLHEAIRVLEVLPAASLYPVAWQALTIEAARRRAGGEPMPIRIRRGAFDDLPVAVRGILTPRTT